MASSISHNDNIGQLHKLTKYANIPLNEALKDVEVTLRQRILEEKHKYAIYYIEKEDAYRTYLPDDSKPYHRRPIKRKSRKDLEEAIIDFYIAQDSILNRENITLENLYKEWLLYRRDYIAVKPKTIQENVNEWNKFLRTASLRICQSRISSHLPLSAFSAKSPKTGILPTSG